VYSGNCREGAQLQKRGKKKGIQGKTGQGTQDMLREIKGRGPILKGAWRAQLKGLIRGDEKKKKTNRRRT